MTNREVGIQLGVVIRDERKVTNELLRLINIALDQRAFLDWGFESMYDWLVRGHGYSKSGAHRRIQAARTLRYSPTATAQLEAGKLNLNKLVFLQSAINAQEKEDGQRITKERKVEILKQLEGKTCEQAQQTLMSLLPAAASEVKRDRKTVVDAQTIRHSINLQNKDSANIQRAREVLWNKMPNATDAELTAYAFEFLLNAIDPLRQQKKETNSRASVNRVVLKRAGGQCEYIDPVTGVRCKNKCEVQVDHITPKALGGGEELANKRARCRQHNLYEAEKIFGKPHMDQFRRQTDE